MPFLKEFLFEHLPRVKSVSVSGFPLGVPICPLRAQILKSSGNGIRNTEAAGIKKLEALQTGTEPTPIRSMSQSTRLLVVTPSFSRKKKKKTSLEATSRLVRAPQKIDTFCNHLKHGVFSTKIKRETAIYKLQCSGVYCKDPC